eukprot:gene6625-8197_t
MTSSQEKKNIVSVGEGELWGKLISLNPIHPSIELRQDTIVIGRTPNLCNVVFNTPTVSGKHCKISRSPTIKGSNVVFVEDTSTNGTFINNEVIGKGSQILIQNGCEISINPKKGSEKISFIYQDCNEEKKEVEEGGPQEKYDLREILGTGNFASVRLAVHKQTGQTFAMKVIDKKKMSMTSQRKDALMDEVNVLTKVNHRNIISIKELFETQKHLYLVLELVTGGELFDRIIAETKFPENTCRFILKQLCDAVHYLHSKGIAHRDLKPENILLSSPDSYEIKISDFGLSRAMDEGTFMKTMCGTPQYVAPEILTKGGKGEGYSKAVDLWSIGVILYIVLCGFPPFGDPQDQTFFARIKKGGFSFPSPHWDSISDEVKDLIKCLIKVNPDERFTIEQTLDHPWFKNHEDDLLPFYKSLKTDSTETTTTTTSTDQETNSNGNKEIEKSPIQDNNETTHPDTSSKNTNNNGNKEIEKLNPKKRALSEGSYYEEQDLKKFKEDEEI